MNTDKALVMVSDYYAVKTHSPDSPFLLVFRTYHPIFSELIGQILNKSLRHTILFIA